MNRDTERLLGDLRQVLAELEALLVQPAEHLERAAAEVERTLDGLRGRVSEMQSHVRRRVSDAVHDANRSVRENPWATVAMAATATLLLGLALGHRASAKHSSSE
jgi:ElaB/YqjD/DUF883 family membrane-anchored ribosome-binding protein